MDAELNEKSRMELFPNISAQLRMAMSTLHMAAQQLASPEERRKDPELDQKAAFLDQSYYRLLRLVNELTAASWIREERKFELRNRDLVELLREVYELSLSLAEPLGLEISLFCEPEELICAMDRGALEQLLYHLLSNAMKYTPRGGKIRLELKPLGERLQITVRDTGKGIAPEELERLFEPGSAGRPPIPPQGLGLGLRICQCIAEGHGGVLLADSTPGKGTCFTLSLPRRLVENRISDVPFEYTGGFNAAKMQLADVLPASAFRLGQP